ncbi:uncharacterized protein HMPREF1541_06903 [Cyphellophora europaea CBS 101466]|uniref:Uncharacterized protein n=1 Tax=Cyphellophora europaea (strain CBS 101466) TaxID=1220924 RepID=W2RQZ6_CYPE1|nr:uncharacterized protein HMPREF1541_06903 [Cyphellophora europaea CBS 101466]ETN38862.1 hypothetical protein HMPREF1541_06903 [Cyphellophora europaea CBS 101466]
MSLTLFVIYNNSTSFLGKLGYNFRRMSATAESGSACAASDLTHGGDDEQEKPEWIETKKHIPATIEQVHYDKAPADLKKYVEKNHYEYPCIVGKGPDGRYHMLLTDSDLGEVSHDYQKFMKVLRANVKSNGLPWDESKPAAVAA